MKSNRFVEFFQIIIDSLNSHELPYILVGGTVMPFFGNIRSTQDIDIMLLLEDVGDEVIEHWLDDLEEKGMILSKSEIIFALNEKIHCNIFDPQTFVFRVDLKRIDTPLDHLSFKYRKEVEVNDRKVWINCAESQIGVKISQGFRSTTDLEDVEAIIETIDLDIDRLNEFINITDNNQYFCNLLRDFDTNASKQLLQQLRCP